MNGYLAQTQFPDRLLALDSLHTQHQTVHQILYDQGADCLLPLKDNQPTILASARTLLPPATATLFSSVERFVP